MFPKNSHSLGGQVTAKKQREKAIKNYYLNPIMCKNCNRIIEIKPNEKVSTVRRKVFCSHSCSAIYSNTSRKKLYFSAICKNCKKPFTIKRATKNMPKRTLCPGCLYDLKHCFSINSLTKKELFSQRKNWQSARSSIRNHAEHIYKSSNKLKVCIVCGYSKHYEVSHLKSVSSFSDDTLISEINNIDNLIALCPTHHWEYDHNELDKPIIEYVKEQKKQNSARRN